MEKLFPSLFEIYFHFLISQSSTLLNILQFNLSSPIFCCEQALLLGFSFLMCLVFIFFNFNSYQFIFSKHSFAFFGYCCSFITVATPLPSGFCILILFSNICFFEILFLFFCCSYLLSFNFIYYYLLSFQDVFSNILFFKYFSSR